MLERHFNTGQIMENKKYSISQIQRLMEISPSELQSLIKENRKHIGVEFLEDADGVRMAYLDAESLKKLIFFKQLKNGCNVSSKEAFEQMNANYSLSNKENKINSMVNALEKEVANLNSKINTLISKYEYAIRELSYSRSVNITLNKRLNLMEARQIALLDQLDKNTAEESINHEIPAQVIN